MKRGALTVMAVGLALTLGLPTIASQAGPWQLAEAPTGAAAEPAMPGDGGPGPHPGMMGMGHHGPAGDMHHHFLRMCENADAHHAAMLAYAEVRLKLTEAQKPAWIKFTEAAKGGHQGMNSLCVEFKAQPAPTTLPERLARAERFASAHLAHLQALRPAVEALYQQLTPEQRKTADDLSLGLPGPHGGPGHHHGDRHGE